MPTREPMGERAVQIIIVNWNSGRQLQDCLQSIEAYAGNAVERVVVVDNGSIDGSADVGGHAGLQLIRTGENLGFAKACNRGAEGASAPYLLFLNPDAALREGTLRNALAFMEGPEAASVGICGAMLLSDGGSLQQHTVRFPTPWSIFAHRFMRTKFDHRHSRPVDHVIGAFYLIRRSVFESLGGFDERFFVYFEDLDLSLRARHRGWGSYYLAEAVAFHKGGGTSEQIKASRLFYSMRSRLLYALKHFGPFGASFTIVMTFSVEMGARLGRALLRWSWQEFRDTIKAYRMLGKSLRGIFRKSYPKIPANQSGSAQ